MPLWELALKAVWAQTIPTLLLKLQTYPQIKSPLHFYGTSGLLPLINLFLSHLLTITRTLIPCRQHRSTLLIIKILLMPLIGPYNPLLCHYFHYYLKRVYDNEMFTIGNTLNCSYGGLGEEISDLHSLRAIRRLGLWLFHQVPSLRAQTWIALHHDTFPSMVDKSAMN